MRLERLSDCAVRVHIGDEFSVSMVELVSDWTAYLSSSFGAQCADVVPSYTGVTLYFNYCINAEVWYRLSVVCDGYSERKKIFSQPTVHRIPVNYTGIDLDFVAERCGRSSAEVVHLHTRPVYTVGMLGFTPGFPYLIGLPQELHLARRAAPRSRVPVGAVAIGGQQTGIYPHESPGGWHIIGYTTVTLFDTNWQVPSLLAPGDKVHFEAI